MIRIPPGFPVIALAALALAGGSADAADPGAPTSSYRLQLDTAAFRLAPVTSPAAAISPQLAAQPYAALIHRAAQEESLEPALVHAVIAVESAYNPGARSPKGAIGLMQVMPETALRYGVRDPARSPQDNLRAGTRYLRDLMQLFNNRLDLVLAAYNAGEQAVLRHGEQIPPYRETRNYVPAVLAKYRELRDPAESAPAAAARTEYLTGTRLEPLHTTTR